MLWLLTHFACQPEVEQRAQIALSISEIDFEEVPIGTWTEYPFFLENTGTLPVQVLSTGIVGASETVWSLSSDEKTTIAEGDVSSFALRFAPNQMREEDVRVQIRLDIEDLPNVYINGYGVGGLSVLDHDEDGFSPADGDCDDSLPSVFPGAVEACDGEDNDCDGVLPDEEEDVDGDGWMECGGDCDDLNNDIYPEAPELCDDLDNDCDGVVPDNQDNDGDGQTACAGDCDDTNPERWFGNAEVCNFIDNDCDGLVDDIDNDGDGHSMCESGGDCDDSNPLAHPVVLDTSTPYEEGDGTPSYPYADFDSALENLDELCRTIMIAPGTHEVNSTIQVSYVKIRGAGEFPEDTVLVQWPGSGSRILYARLTPVVDISNITFFASSTVREGAALQIKGTNAAVIAEDVFFIDNESNGTGGAVYVESSNFSCHGCEFSQNSTIGSGGAIGATWNSIIDIEDSLFYDNSAQAGGAISSEDSQITVSDSIFSSNTAFGEGGAIALYTESKLLSTRDSYWENQADSYGGAISFRHIDAPPSIILNARFQDNLSYLDGGAIAALGSQASFLVGNSTFTANFATNNGGDLYADTDATTDGIWMWSNISSLSYGAEAFYVADWLTASFAYSTCHQHSNSSCYLLPEGADEGQNTEDDPMFVFFDDNNDSSDDDLGLQSGSPMLNTGPFDGLGPFFHTTWSNVDGTRNHRGHTGGSQAD